MIREDPQSRSRVEELEHQQAVLREELDLTHGLETPPELVAGLDVSYEIGTQNAVAAAVLIDVNSLTVLESAIVHTEVTFPYIPGFLGFREAPILEEALGKLGGRPDLLVCDGYGIAHPRRFGLASHIGVLTGLPSFGVAKSPFTTAFVNPGPQRGEWSPLTEDGEVLGRVLRTQTGVKPVFVSVGHRVTLEQATELTLRMSPQYRIPEATRKADHLSREALRTRDIR